jgi:hypothetical protein
MAQYAKLVNGSLMYPPLTMIRPDGTTIVGYNHNTVALQEDGWKPIVFEEQPTGPCSPVYSEVDNMILVTWELLPVPEPVPLAPQIIEGGIEVPVLVLQSLSLGKGIVVVATDEGDLTTHIDHESPRPADEIIEARKATAVAAKKAAKNTAKAAAKKGNLQERIAAIEAFLGIT